MQQYITESSEREIYSEISAKLSQEINKLRAVDKKRIVYLIRLLQGHGYTIEDIAKRLNIT